MSVLARVFGGIALLLLTFVGIGILLPGEWEAEATGRVEVLPDSVYEAVSRIGVWHRWMPWPDTGARTTGPPSGPGATVVWEDPVYGEGRVRIEEAVRPRTIAYRVTVEDGSIVVRGRLELRPSGGGTEIRWTEDGEAGWNPLVGYAALSQGERQSDQLRSALERLARYLESGRDQET